VALRQRAGGGAAAGAAEAAMQWLPVLRELRPVIERIYFIPGRVP
jgi:hypothetical protein